MEVVLKESFGSYDLQIYESQSTPLFLVNDVMTNLLKYDRASDCRWFRKLQKNIKYVVRKDCGNLPHQDFLTKRGFFEVLSKSDKLLAVEFRDKLYEFVDGIADKCLEEQKQITQQQAIEIQELKKERTGLIYEILVDGVRRYIGKTFNYQTRQNQHLKEINDLVEDFHKKSQTHYLLLAADTLMRRQIIFNIVENNIDDSLMAQRESVHKQLSSTQLYCTVPQLKAVKQLPQHICKTEDGFHCDLCNKPLKKYGAHLESKKHKSFYGSEN